MAEKENKTIIFVETKKRCDDLTRRMRRDGLVPRCFQVHLVQIKSNCRLFSIFWISFNYQGSAFLAHLRGEKKQVSVSF